MAKKGPVFGAVKKKESTQKVSALGATTKKILKVPVQNAAQGQFFGTENVIHATKTTKTLVVAEFVNAKRFSKTIFVALAIKNTSIKAYVESAVPKVH